MNLSYVTEKYRTGRRWIIDHVYQPVLSRTATYLSKKANIPPETLDDPATSCRPDWKDKASTDFNDWLSDLPDDIQKPGAVETESCDLFTLLTEFVHLRQEIRAQNLEQQKVMETQQALIDDHHTISGLFESRTRQLENLEENIRLTCEKKAVVPFLDTRDALIRGLAYARKAAATRGFFRRPPKNIDAVVDGYETSLRRFDRALSFVGIQPVDAIGQSFDPSTMDALDRRFEAGAGPDMVIEQLVSGFVKGTDVLRKAQVVVNSPEES